ncbi:MAG TPA: amidohydrolase family protein [Terracidiphilus sp.]|nr:amidohydrolase family protein [Terracidiphilus sp.]
MLTRRRFLAQSAAGLLAAPLSRAAHAALPSAPRRPLMIDAHVHVFKHDPEFPFAPGAKPPAEDAPVETLIELMRANGVARTVIIQVIHYKWDNRYLASVLKRYPGMFQGVCRVNPEDPAAPDRLSRLTEEGFRGVRISPAADATGDWIRGPLMPPLWRRCNQLRVPMTVLAPVTRMPDLASLIEANPELDVVIDHMADCPLHRPDELRLLLDLARYPRVFVKISDMWVLSQQPYPYADAQEQVKRLLAQFGAQRLMWDTNWPVSLKQLPYARIVALYRDHFDFVSPEEHREILSGTVQRVWPFGL